MPPSPRTSRRLASRRFHSIGYSSAAGPVTSQSAAPFPRVTASPPGPESTRHDADPSRPSSAWTVRTPGGPSQDPRFASKPRKPMISSSMPSAANWGANAGSPVAPAPAAACCASTRWIAVSCACRRAQNASGDGASRNVQQVMPGSADPGMTCWTFLEAPSPLAFWARRQAHETAIHRVDAQQAAAGAGATGEPAFAPQFAADGIDELIMGFLGLDAKRGSWDGPPGILTLHADDGAEGSAQWRVLSGPGGLAVTREDGAADCEITGQAADLYLLL